MLFVFFITTTQSYSQVAGNINGFNCVTPGVPYQYIFTGDVDSSLSIQVCVTGGLIAADLTACKTAKGMTTVSVVWNDSATTGSIQVNYAGKTITRNVNITPLLYGGSISPDIKTQFVDSTNVPADIICAQSHGGGCSPGYSYQWQASKDFANWKDISGATGKNLKFANHIPRALYFRRKTTETNSGTIAYSDEAVVFVN